WITIFCVVTPDLRPASSSSPAAQTLSSCPRKCPPPARPYSLLPSIGLFKSFQAICGSSVRRIRKAHNHRLHRPKLRYSCSAEYLLTQKAECRRDDSNRPQSGYRFVESMEPVRFFHLSA